MHDLHWDARLAQMRTIADAMLGTGRNWNWDGPVWGEFGVTKERAEQMQAKYGGRVWQSETEVSK